MPKNYTISAVVLSKNSEKKIGKCLESLKGWADEIILVDGQSTDNTVDIAKGFGAVIVSHPFLGSFAAERNSGTEKAKSDWVLQLDSDEIVSEEFKKKCAEILPGTKYAAFKFRRKNVFLGHEFRYGGWYHWSQHLFKGGKARYEGRVHEKMIVDGEVGNIDADILHVPFDSISEFIERQNRYTDLQAKDILDTEKDIDSKKIAYNLKVKPFKLFRKMYFKNKGYREGMYGLVFSMLFAWVHFLKWAKVWELVRDRKNILVIRNDRFGEFLLNIPAIRALKERFPDSKIILAVDPYVKELAGCVSYADEIVAWRNGKHRLSEIIRFAAALRKKDIDIAVVMNPSKDSNIAVRLAGIPERVGYAHKWDFLLTKKIDDRKHLEEKHEVEYNLDLVKTVDAGTKNKALTLEIKDRPGVKFSTGSVGYVAIHPWTSDPVKQWPVERFRETAIRLVKEFDLDVAIVGGKEEAGRSANFNYLDKRITNMTGKTSLPELAAALKKARLLISGDSGPVHLAVSVGTPVIALFRNDIRGKGPKRWGPWGANNIIIDKRSLSDISVEEVLNRVREWKSSSSSILSV
jgi:ADP-heptose:LPS heptosyltransferase